MENTPWLVLGVIALILAGCAATPSQNATGSVSSPAAPSGVTTPNAQPSATIHMAQANTTASNASGGERAGEATATIAQTRPAGHAVDDTRLPIGDGKLSESARSGYVMRCGNGGAGGGGAQGSPSWDNGDGTWNARKKVAVQGDVKWAGEFSVSVNADARTIWGNDLPSNGTGVFPIARSDPAHAYDANPNSIQAQSMNLQLPAQPALAAAPSCLTPGPIGVMVDGVFFFDALDAENRDAGFHETQDACDGHPEKTGEYHHHTGSACIGAPLPGQWKLVGYALDGFGVYDYRDADGGELTNADLDECHGRTDVVPWDGRNVSMYHYQITKEFPYTLGCFRGTPSKSGGAGQVSGQMTATDGNAGTGPRTGGQTDGAGTGGTAGGQMDGPDRSPPPQAIAACAGKTTGATCAFDAPMGTLSGTCQSPQGTRACVPSR